MTLHDITWITCHYMQNKMLMVLRWWLLYWWPTDGWQRGTVARLCPRGTWWHTPCKPRPCAAWRTRCSTLPPTVSSASGTPIFGIYLVTVYTTYIPCICRPDRYTWYILYHVYPPGIYVVYPWLYMVYHLTYIHGIYVVYPWIFLDF